MKTEKKRKICIIDPLSPFGHRDVNRIMIELTKEFGKLTVISSISLISKKVDGVEYIQYDDGLFKITSNALKNRKRLLYVLKMMSRVLVKRKFDVIIFTSYELITLYFAVNILKYLPKNLLKKTFMLNHANVDEVVQSNIKEFLFKRLSGEIRFLCYDKYVGDMIRQRYKKEWMPIRHNLNDYKKIYEIKNIRSEIKDFFSEKDKYIYIIIPGELAFHDDIIDQLIQLDRLNYLEEKAIKVFIKDKNVKFKSDNILVFNEYMKDDEYSYIFEKCDYVTIIYDPSKYVYRSSGIFFDAVSFMKPMIYCSNMFFEDKEKKFGKLGIKYKGSVKECLEKLPLNNKNDVIESIMLANDYYSNNNLKEDIRLIVESV